MVEQDFTTIRVYPSVKEKAEKLKIKLLKQEKAIVVKRFTEDHEAYEIYLKGRYFWNKRSEDGLEKGIQLFRQAIEKDPLLARAYAGIAACYINLGAYFVNPQETRPKMKQAILIANLTLPIEDQIDIVDIHQGDGRLKFLDYLSSESYSLPKLIIDTPSIVRGNFKNSRIIVNSASDRESNINAIKLINNKFLNLY